MKLLASPKLPGFAEHPTDPAGPGWKSRRRGVLAAALVATALIGMPLSRGSRAQPPAALEPAASVYRKGGTPAAAAAEAGQPTRGPASGAAKPDEPGAASGSAAGQQSAQAPAELAPAGQASPAEQAAQAERIVLATLAALGRAESISARVRERVRVDDRVIVGAGRYVQSGLGEDQRYRYESSLKSDTETFEILEVCDGLFAWSFRRVGPQPPTLERLDVRRVRERLQQLQPTHDAMVSPYLGGVQRTLSLLRDWFRFVRVEPDNLDGVPVWKVEGRWHPEALMLLQPDKKDAIMRPEGIAPDELPDGMPWRVRLLIGRRELFPFRVEWLAIPGRRPVAGREPEPIAVLELFDVRLGEPVDAAAFVYRPSIKGLVDMTDMHVKYLAPLRP